ncbi:MAG: hypothetical protein J7604_01890 [Sporocytophaga sp.]|uniref:hypothetical protein n=1 Tax=Sporocytophaga sp. TaxID=2231183 RepID=UPI001B0E9212|nr:hypothetical protein [Sporocytophaga sp.]MBO9698926.1 hypothetical protein [Sporocytophaga sp.]
MKKNIFSVIMICLLFFTLGCSKKEVISSDLNKLCELANQISMIGDGSNSSLIFQFISEADKLNLSSDTRKLLNELSVKSKASYGDFTDFASINGVENFECSSIKKMFEE